MSGSVPLPVCLTDYERLAEQRLDAGAWAYFSGGSADEITVRSNSSRFGEIQLIPRVLRGGPGGNTRVTLLGRTYAHPIFVAPMAYQKLAHPDGELATAMAAAAQDACMVLSTQASITLEEAARAGATCRWFQLYLQPQREATQQLVHRAEAAGYEAFVVTVDAPVNGVRNREHRADFQLPPGIAAVSLLGLPPVKATARREDVVSPVFDHFVASAPTWDDVAWLRAATKLPILLKGILSPADAEIAVSCGVDGIIVSNHGGRTLDTAPATITVLPEIAAAVGRRVPLLVDGGIRRGTDVLKALALGASAILVGRPIVYGLAANGAHGVAHVLRLLRDEFEIAMALTGCRVTGEITPDLIWM